METASDVPSICCVRQQISVQSPSVLTFLCSLGFYQDYGDHGGRPPDAGDHRHPVPGQPSTKGAISRPSALIRPRDLSISSPTREDAEIPEVAACPIPATIVPRFATGYRPTEFFLEDKIRSIQHLVHRVLSPRRVSVHLYIHLLRKMVDSFEALQFGRFHSWTF